MSRKSKRNAFHVADESRKSRCAAKRNARMARAHSIWSKLGPKEPIPFYNRATEKAFNRPDVRVQ